MRNKKKSFSQSLFQTLALKISGVNGGKKKFCICLCGNEQLTRIYAIFDDTLRNKVLFRGSYCI